MKNTIFSALSLLFLLISSFQARAYEVQKSTYLEVNSSINPATYNYLATNIKKLSASRGDIAIIKLNTPGGLVSTTKKIITLIGEQDFPIIVWITPEGASATSAGAIIASSAHFLVMSGGTNIGAATPIAMGKDIKEKDARNKSINDLVALVKSLSNLRGRNSKNFEEMISLAKSFDAASALKSKTIDAIVNSEKELLNYINKKEVLIKGRPLKISLAQSMTSKTIEMDPGQKILNIFSDPSTAYILFIIGAALLYFELQAPGGFLAGSLGALCLILAAIGFQVLPLNFGAVGLVALSFILFILEAYITSYGLLSLAGIASLTFGSLFLFRTEDSYLALETTLVFSTVSAIALYIGFLGFYIFKNMGRKEKFFTHTEHKGSVLKMIEENDNKFIYQVKVNGEIWNATSHKSFNPGDKVEVTEQNEDKLMLTIK